MILKCSLKMESKVFLRLGTFVLGAFDEAEVSRCTVYPVAIQTYLILVGGDDPYNTAK